jgi:signal transduction histidine kinase
MVRGGEGVRSMARIQQVSDEIVAEERRRLESRAAAAAASSARTTAAAYALALTSLVTLSGCFLLIRSDLRQRRRLERAKNELLQHVSHELRAPLTAIHLFAANLRDGIAGRLTTEQQRD